MKIKILGIFIGLPLILITPSVIDAHLIDRYDFRGENIIIDKEMVDAGNEVDDIGWYTSLALDEDNYPHISYYDYTNGDLKYAYFDGINWCIEIVDSDGDVGRYTSIALDKDGYPHISYYDYTNGDLKYAYFTGNLWDIGVVDRIGNVGLYTSIALDSHGYPHISYCDYSKRALKYAHWTGSNWEKIVVDKSAEICVYEYFGDYTSIALDSKDHPHISYCDFENYDLKYAYYNGGTWNKEVVDSKGDVGQYSSIAIDCYDNPHISYGCLKNTFLTFDLKYAEKINGVWSIETVDKDGDVRKWTSLDLDSNGYPHISYYDYTEGALKYTYFNGMNWSKETVETNGSTGCFNCLHLNSDDGPCISYYDWGNKALKYAYLTEDNWVIQIIEMDTNTDFLDQQQNYCCGYVIQIADDKPLAQSFIPTYPVLTRVELMVVKRYDPAGFTVSIRKDLDGMDLTSIYLPPSEIAEDLSWKNFDFPDIELTPGETYYIVCSSEDTDEINMYYWYFGIYDPYHNGCGWIKNGEWDILTSSSAFPDMDLGFKTFGLDTGIPSPPIIEGPSTGKIGAEYEYNFTSVDPDGDDVWYIVEWDATDSGIYGPYKSGETATLTHSWSRQGNYIIQAKTIDQHGAESNWATLEVNMPVNKGYYINPLIRFLYRLFNPSILDRLI